MNRLLILGGAILVLAGCDRATAPTISQHEGAPAAARKDATIGTMTAIDLCTWVRLGPSDSTLVCETSIY